MNPVNSSGGTGQIQTPEVRGLAVVDPAATEMITLLLILAFSFTPIALGITVWLSASTLQDDVKPVATENTSELSKPSE